MKKLSTVLMGLALLGFAGCGSSDTEPFNPFADAYVEPVVPDAGTTITAYGISTGAWCYKITSVSAVSDGCQLSVGSLVGSSLPGTYEGPTTGIFTLGTKGSLGGGAISNNVGTLTRLKGSVSDPAVPGCSWNQADTTTVTMTAENMFTASVVETQDTIATACGFTGGTTCTSSWTWTMEIDGLVAAPACK